MIVKWMWFCDECACGQARKKKESRKAILMMPFVFVSSFRFHHFNFYDFCPYNDGVCYTFRFCFCTLYCFKWHRRREVGRERESWMGVVNERKIWFLSTWFGGGGGRLLLWPMYTKYMYFAELTPASTPAPSTNRYKTHLRNFLCFIRSFYSIWYTICTHKHTHSHTQASTMESKWMDGTEGEKQSLCLLAINTSNPC